ncbi:MAG: hypothetical protein GXO37_00605 [Chloroflexi bacterium]|nr:hypothetical protein [Chloroflexota bacterium]
MMDKRPLGCLSPSALVAAALALVGVAVAWAWVGNTMFSPGPLNAQTGAALGGVTSHAELEKECRACHAPFWSSDRMADRCLRCHTTVAEELPQPDSLHGSLLSGASELTCRGCHTEHRGPDAPLTVLDARTFPHAQTGFALDAHRTRASGEPFACQDCHTQGYSSFDQAVCDQCHQQVTLAFAAHTQTFGTDCLACHDGLDTYGRNFDHGLVTGFPLEGGHARAACADCHQGARNLQDLRAVDPACVACHADQDVHAGRYGTRCETCHTALAWEQVSFDHSVTAFPLTGAHAELECESCHLGGEFTALDTACAACHNEPDYHAGLFTGPCDACHNTTAWRPARYDEPHTFPLNHGRRTASECQVCHPTTLQDYTCYGCHEHTPTNIAAEHREEGIFNFDNCVECHPTGREEEAEDD